ncbi:MAG: ABC transporter permease [Peptococcaceae bacterium]|nr:ABC transporter permease [Peptococcaceae bacterium]
MFHVNNRKAIAMISKGSMKANRLRNLMAICAIALTAVLFTSLFTVGGSILTSVEHNTMRQVGTSAHGGFKFLTQEQYDKLTQDPTIKELSYDIYLAMGENKALKNVYTEIRYCEDLAAKWRFSYPDVGDMPRQGKEIATSDVVLDALGVPHEIGAEVPLEFTVHGKQYKEVFTLSGYWRGDPVAVSQSVWLSREYVDSVTSILSVPLYESGSVDIAGSINPAFMFANPWDLEEKVARVKANCDFSDFVNEGVNWAYTASEIDVTSVLLLVGLILLIGCSGYLIIFNIFYIAVARDIRFYGLLKTIGTTAKQLKRIVRRQALFLCFLGTPLGLLLGALIGRFLVPVVLSITDLTEFDMVVSVHPIIFIIAAIFTVLTVLISCRKPCHIAGIVSPIEAIRYTEMAGGKKKSKRRLKKVRLGTMAYENVFRNQKKALVVIASLSLSMILLNGVYTLVHGFDMDKFIANSIISDFQVASPSLYAPLGYLDTDVVTDADMTAFAALPGVTDLEAIYFKENMHIPSEAALSRVNEMMAVYGEEINPMYREEIVRRLSEEGDMAAHIYGVGPLICSKISLYGDQSSIDWEKFNTGNYVIVDPFRVDANGEVLYYEVGETVTLQFGNGREKEYEVLAIGTVPYAVSAHHSHYIDPNFVLPEQEFMAQYPEALGMAAILDVEDQYISSAEEWLTAYCDTVNDQLQSRSAKTYEEEFQTTKMMFTVVGGGLSGVLGVIGILNFVNAMITSLIARRRELAMLESIGMTSRQIQTTLCLEGLYYILFTVGITATIGAVIVQFLAQLLGQQIGYFTYRFTVVPVLYCLPWLVLIAILVPLVSNRLINRQSVVERLRQAE